jgi:hypothetical protein
MKAFYQVKYDEIDSFVAILKASYPEKTLKITVETVDKPQRQPEKQKNVLDALPRDHAEEKIGVILSDGFLVAGGTGGIGFTSKQLAAIGVPWPPEKGWKKALAGKSVSLAAARKFMEMGKTVREPAYVDKWLNSLQRTLLTNSTNTDILKDTD